MSVLGPVLLSLKVALLATVFATVAGLGLARFLAAPRSRFAPLAEGLVLLPMVFPPTVTGYVLLLLFGRHGPMGAALAAFGLRVVFTEAAAVIAATVVSLPLAYQHCKSALLATEARLADAGRTLGLSELAVFRRITLPLALPGVLGGAAMAFARAFGEFGATIMLAGNIPGRTQTVPLALYSAVEGGREGEARAYLLVTTAVALLVVLAAGAAQAASSAGRGRPGGSR